MFRWLSGLVSDVQMLVQTHIPGMGTLTESHDVATGISTPVAYVPDVDDAWDYGGADDSTYSLSDSVDDGWGGGISDSSWDL